MGKTNQLRKFDANNSVCFSLSSTSHFQHKTNISDEKTILVLYVCVMWYSLCFLFSNALLNICKQIVKGKKTEEKLKKINK